jgi:hypothetical protein
MARRQRNCQLPTANSEQRVRGAWGASIGQSGDPCICMQRYGMGMPMPTPVEVDIDRDKIPCT